MVIQIQIQIRPWKQVATLTSTARQGELTLRKKTLVSRPRSQRPRGKAAQRPCPQRINADKGHRSVRTTLPYANKIVSPPVTVQVFGARVCNSLVLHTGQVLQIGQTTDTHLRLLKYI